MRNKTNESQSSNVKPLGSKLFRHHAIQLVQNGKERPFALPFIRQFTTTQRIRPQQINPTSQATTNKVAQWQNIAVTVAPSGDAAVHKTLET
jgi:hypothetical protein